MSLSKQPTSGNARVCVSCTGPRPPFGLSLFATVALSATPAAQVVLPAARYRLWGAFRLPTDVVAAIVLRF